MSNQTKTPLNQLIYELTKSATISEHSEYKSGLLYAIELAKSKLPKEKQIIVDAVNATDEKCVSHANISIRHLTKQTGNLFDHSGEEGLKYYNDNFSN